MSIPSEMTARHAATLAELAGIGMEMARALQAEVQAAETPQERVRAVAAYPKVARAVRQCLMLEAKFVRDAAQAEREAHAAAAPERDAARARRREQVRQHLTRIIHDRHEVEGLDYNETLEAWLADLKDGLHEDVLDPEVLDLPFDAVVARICADLGLPLEDEQVGDDQDGDDEEDEAPVDAVDSAPRLVHRPGPDDVTYDDPPPPEPDFRYSNSS